MGPRLAWAALFVIVAAAAVVTGQGPEPLEERFTTCWPCHIAWPTPLQSFYHIQPPAEAGGLETFDYTVQVKNPWLHEILFLEPSLDISGAPSLKFFDGREPLQLASTGSIAVGPTTLVGPDGPASQRGHIVVEIPTGATDLAFTLQVRDPVYPYDVALRVYPGSIGPNGTPAFIIDEAGAGQAETFPPAGVDKVLQDYGTGNWTLEAEITPIGNNPNPVVRNVPFDVNGEIAFNANDEVVQFLSQAVQMGPDQSELITWRLQPIGTPAAGETVKVRVDAMVFFEHEPSSQADDFANITKEIDLQVIERDGGVFLVADPDAVPAPSGVAVVTVSMTAISEAVGYMAGFLLIFSVYTGGMFGRASRRHLNVVFGSARRRVAFHNFLSYALTVAAIVHLVLFIIETKYHWTLGLIWGGLGLLAMIGLGITGALQVPIIRRWNYGSWRWTHLGLAILSLVFTVVHLLLDGAHFGEVQDFVGWSDPLDNRGLLNTE